MTTTMVELSEVQAANSQLDALPAAWLTEEFVDAVRDRALASATARLLAERHSAAQSRLAAGLAGLSAGDQFDATLAEVLSARRNVDDLAAIRQVVVPVVVDPAVAGAVLTAAGQSLARVSVEVHPLDYAAEVSWWAAVCQRTRSTVTPPTATDLDRETETAWTAASTEVQAWRSARGNWTGAASKAGAEPVSLLLGASQLLEQAESVTRTADTANALIDRANKDRASAGLTWNPSTSQRLDLSMIGRNS